MTKMPILSTPAERTASSTTLTVSYLACASARMYTVRSVPWQRRSLIFGGQLFHTYPIVTEKDSSVTQDRDHESIVSVCVRHLRRMPNSRQVHAYTVMRIPRHEHHESH